MRLEEEKFRLVKKLVTDKFSRALFACFGVRSSNLKLEKLLSAI